jgi:hypothetical protein
MREQSRAAQKGAEPLGAAIGPRVEAELVGQFGTTPQVRRVAAQAARFLEVAEQARDLVATEGLVLDTKQGRFRHPALEIERTMRLAYLAAVRLLESPRRGKVGHPAMGEALPRGRGGASAGPASRFFKAP